MRDARDCAAGILEHAQLEVEELMQPAGLDMEWRHLDLLEQIEPVAHLVVLTFAGTCSSSGESDSAKHPESAKGRGARLQTLQEHRISRAEAPSCATCPRKLGWTHLTDGEILPFCTVDCDRVRGMISPLTRQLPMVVRDRFYATAMGRVVAHELFHILGKTTKHAREGLAKSHLTPSELIQGSCSFGAREINLIRRSLVGIFGRNNRPGQQQVDLRGNLHP